MGKYNENTKVKEILKDRQAVEIVENVFPNITKNRLLVFFENMSLNQLAVKAVKLHATERQIQEIKDKLLEL